MDYRKIEEIINYFNNRLKADAFQVNQIILFGSQSDGSANDESDIDLCIISRDFEGKGILQRAKMVRNANGIALITQYNPHGIFIAMEELGFIMMAVSFGFLIPVFKGKYTSVISIINLIAVITAAIGFVYIHTIYGLDKMDRYEVIIIMISWITLILNGIIIGKKVRKLWGNNK